MMRPALSSIFYKTVMDVKFIEMSALRQPDVTQLLVWVQPDVTLVPAWCQPDVSLVSAWCQPDVRF